MSNNSSHSEKQSGSTLKTLFFLAIIAFSAFFWYSVFYGKADQLEGRLEILSADYSEIENIHIDYQLNLADVDIEYVNLGNTMYEGSWDHYYMTSDSEYVPIEIYQELSVSEDNKTLIITITDNFDEYHWDNFMFFSETNFQIKVNNQYTQSITSDVGSGNINIIAEFTEFSDIWLEQNAGNLYFTSDQNNISNFVSIGLTGNGHFDIFNSEIDNVTDIYRTTGNLYWNSDFSSFNDVSLRSNTGNIHLDTYDALFNGDLYIVQSTGNTYLNLEDTVGKNIKSVGATGNAHINAQFLLLDGSIEISRSTGNVYLDILHSSMNNITSTISTGNFDLELMYSTLLGDINLIGTTGNTYINIQEVEINAFMSTAGSGNFDMVMEYVNITKNMQVHRQSGEIDMHLTETTNTQEIDMTLSTGSGNIDLYWENYETLLDFDFNIEAETEYGDIDMTIYLPEISSGRVNVSAESEYDDPDIDIDYTES